MSPAGHVPGLETARRRDRHGRAVARVTRSKYGAKPTMLDGLRFDSRLEAHRWAMLSIMQQMGEISDLRRQVRFPLMVGPIRLGDYVADFVYSRDGSQVIEDAKGVLTPMARWKIKHMAAQGDTVSLWPEKPAKPRQKANRGKR